MLQKRYTHRSPLTALLSLALALSALLLIPVPAHAQDAPLEPETGAEANIEGERMRFRPVLQREVLVYRLRGDGEHRATVGMANGADGQDAQIDHTLEAMVGAPLYQGNVPTIDLLFEYQFDREHGALVGNLLGPTTEETALELHRFELALPVHLRLSPDWGVELGARVIYAGDLERYDPEAWLPFLRASAAWRFADDWAFLFGAVSARISDLWLPLPIVGLYWRPDGPFGFDILLPNRIEGRWWAFESVPSLHFFAGTYFDGVNWHVREQAWLNRILLDGVVGARYGLDLPWPLELETRIGSNLMQFTSVTPDNEDLEGDSWLEGPTFTFTAGVVVRTD